MIAELKRTEQGYSACFERHFKQPVARVWAMLTENGKLQQWFPELKVEELRTGGIITFDMQDGSFKTMEIVEMLPESVLEYTWSADLVRFELSPEDGGGCRLVLIEKLTQLTEHTPRDLAGWDVCLDVIGALLDGREFGPRHPVWAKRYEEYKQRIDAL
ncbi:SRPBCC family protein [Paenibacillus sp. NFR01]|uniref:SRPBCC family protein n=1 Tax=Paenibacillus sp. NFR01 TaxID=1566279 RepID=UPI0008BC4E57|nr:SRPBCC family protein [Paenibacillus sp. NFR01]SEU10268.1 Uncharacterized conserved protein YndB, AHSA1/START domain [Paenibacillus sp. NFR01]